MTLAISGYTGSAVLSYGSAKPSAVALQAQLQRFEQQLSDCVNCASAGTPEGKSDIEALAARITQVRQRIAQADAAAAPAPAPAPADVAPAGRIDTFA